MTREKLLWFLDLFERLGTTVWIDGGWGVDALLGRQTRAHSDLDIIIPWRDSALLSAELAVLGFSVVPTDDQSDRNFVLGHAERGNVDFHVVELREDGGAVYGPGEIDFEISADELSASGEIRGRRVRCLSAEYQVRSHAGYVLKQTDIHDVRELHRRFGVRLLPEQEEWPFGGRWDGGV